ncbi:hypothetical protein KUL25_02820 [Rhodobacteraceae bacterium N5(2021)]|uniref:Uncharacterized protein n=1 Tax=Gymnodinialimonas phycosphaerae TaxID=2841589 RepID=A0A975YGJ5_9RHOB|nr:hypothetical protein [Gymnodinialimonas phycosphaerae]MBY4891694.1 hypothetical protein [Gymnodinialimonas phycosphaerae]
MRALLVLGLVLACAGPLFYGAPLSAQTVHGITLGAPVPASLPQPDDTQTQAPLTRRYWADLAGLQVTAIADSETGDVHFVELRPAAGGPVDTPISGIRFGQTTQADLQARFGSEGIVFANVGRAGAFGEVAAYFTTYEIEGGDTVVSFTTTEPLAETSEGTSARSTLDSVVVAQGTYLNQVWGLNRGRLPGYAPIPDPFGD